MDTHLADDLTCRHVIDVWKHAVEYMQQQQARAGGAHQWCLETFTLETFALDTLTLETFTLAEDLLCIHVIDVWMLAVEYMQQLV